MSAIGLSALAVALRATAPDAASVVQDGERCPTMSLSDRTADYLGRPASGVSVKATLTRRDDLWSLRLRIDDTERVFSAPHCDTVIDAGAFVVATTIDPSVSDLAAGEPEPQSKPQRPEVVSPRVGATPAAAVEPVEPPPTLSSRSSRSAPLPPPSTAPNGVVFIAGADVGVQFGSLPGAGLWVTPSLGVGGPRWRALVTGGFRTRSRALAPSDPGDGDAPDAGGDLGVWALGIRGCGLPAVGRPRLAVPLCGGVEAGQLLGSGFGFSSAQNTTLPWLAITASPGVAFVPTPRLSLVLAGEFGVAPLAGQFVIDGLGPVHRVGRVFGRFTVGAQVRFGARQTR